MSGIVQQKSASGSGVASVSVAFDNPVVKGNLIIAAIHAASQSVGVSDGSNTYFIALNAAPAGTHIFTFYSAKAGASGSVRLTATLASGTDEMHLHIFEVAGGYDTTEQSGSNYNASNSLNGTVSTADATTHADSFVLAMFADNFGSGVTWTPGAGFTAGQTTSGGHVVFSEGREVTSAGVQTATASQNFSNVIASGIATFYASSGGGGGGGSTYDPTKIFLGSVRVLSSAPANQRNPFIGTVTVITSAPVGESNPYLGSVVVGAPGPNNNPDLGQVVVVADVPAGQADIFFGTVKKI